MGLEQGDYETIFGTEMLNCKSKSCFSWIIWCNYNKCTIISIEGAAGFSVFLFVYLNKSSHYLKLSLLNQLVMIIGRERGIGY